MQKSGKKTTKFVASFGGVVTKRSLLTNVLNSIQLNNGDLVTNLNRKYRSIRICELGVVSVELLATKLSPHFQPFNVTPITSIQKIVVDGQRCV